MNPIQTKELDKVREDAIRKSTQNVTVHGVRTTSDTIIITSGTLSVSQRTTHSASNRKK